ncbi:MAG: hypothetical protein A2X34_09355 [Elusimicrobia bacterium GWC2_51_8]|nr:MAG: hypothetical protein A2X33_01085 [Elusimicrobia bacterium GWA2_51_34]OGR60307.1 MAG: hypothetical protein A2X34_09355 [Elusimicrobia bacterium GWC2_51_8]OGR85868.1 MAG: hypothetical protein A2021_03250 [Elusimicrobia bacterium GWF2_52_66]HAF96120.1 hypothetical protein [Elusimicrobiota bacterium]HCE97245.1 hypothetical protein [Elusimicrobiota bacterium]
MSARRPNKFKDYTRKELIDYCWRLYRKHGIRALEYQQLVKSRGLCNAFYLKGIGQKKLIAYLGLKKQYQKHVFETWSYKCASGKIVKRWNWERLIRSVSKIRKKLGYLPPAGWFHKNNLSGIVGSIYTLGKTWGDLRDYFHDEANSAFFVSRNGLRWRSRAEKSLSDYLYARGVSHKKGRRYPDEYTRMTGRAYGYYDLQFKACNRKWIDVEIWGDKPLGHNEADYATKREQKERFNGSNPLFLGLQFQDCYSDYSISKLLKPYIGKKINNLRKHKHFYDIGIETSHWSDADELLETCKQIAKTMPGGIFPTEEWLRKRGKFTNRKGFAYNTVAIYIQKWFRGIRQLRFALGQPEESTTAWTKKLLVKELAKWHRTHNCSPGAFVTAWNRRGKPDSGKDVANWASCLGAAIHKYFDSTKSAYSAVCKTRKI